MTTLELNLVELAEMCLNAVKAYTNARGNNYEQRMFASYLKQLI